MRQSPGVRAGDADAGDAAGGPQAGAGAGPPAGVRHRDSDRGALVAGHLSALCHWRACRLQALRDPRSILVGEW